MMLCALCMLLTSCHHIVPEYGVDFSQLPLLQHSVNGSAVTLPLHRKFFLADVKTALWHGIGNTTLCVDGVLTFSMKKEVLEASQSADTIAVLRQCLYLELIQHQAEDTLLSHSLQSLLIVGQKLGALNHLLHPLQECDWHEPMQGVPCAQRG